MARKKKSKSAEKDVAAVAVPATVEVEADDDVVILRKKSAPDIFDGASDEVLMKNESNLYLIKSYSFIDKTTKSKRGGGGKPRPESAPVKARESFLRHFQSFRKSFARKGQSGAVSSGSSSSGGSASVDCELSEVEFDALADDGGCKLRDLEEVEEAVASAADSKSTDVDRLSDLESVAGSERSTGSVTTVLQTSPDLPPSMAILKSQQDLHGHSVTDLTTIGKSPSHLSSAASASGSSCNLASNSGGSKADLKSLKSSNHTSPTSTPSAGQLALHTRSLSPHPKAVTSTAVVPAKNEIPEKEKKRKELSSSRQKKFHRHFQQVPKDEKVINYFSCALVSDILLQGHLYITDTNLAFYSNVFGFVTKLLIPTASVIKISKEKTAKIIPNAVGVATSDERHVFGSFMSREAAFRLMCSVCPPMAPIEVAPKVVRDVEECSIEDDSSCSISGNESPQSQVLDSAATASDASQTVLRQRGIEAIASIAASTLGAGDVVNGSPKVILLAPCASTPVKALTAPATINILPAASPISGCTTSSQSSSPTSVISSPPLPSSPPRSSFKAFAQLKFPTEFHIVYLGVFLTVVLALFSVFLLYRILDIEAKAGLHSRSAVDFNWGSGNDADIFAEALKWQRELQAKSTEEAQNILSSNLEQIAKVRRSLETLSMLIHDRSSSSAPSSCETGGLGDAD